jgi:hypothetical protein
MFRTDKPLPPLPKGITDAFSSVMARATQAPPPLPPKKPDQSAASTGAAGRSKSPSRSNDLTSFGAATFSQAKQLFEGNKPASGAGGNRQAPTTPSYAHMAMAAAKHVPVGTAVDMAKKVRAALARAVHTCVQVPTDTWVAAATSAHPEYAKHVPLNSMIDTAKKVDTKHYVQGAQMAQRAGDTYNKQRFACAGAIHTFVPLYSSDWSTSRPDAMTNSSTGGGGPSVNALRSQLQDKLVLTPQRQPPKLPDTYASASIHQRPDTFASASTHQRPDMFAPASTYHRSTVAASTAPPSRPPPPKATSAHSPAKVGARVAL